MQRRVPVIPGKIIVLLLFLGCAKLILEDAIQRRGVSEPRKISTPAGLTTVAQIRYHLLNSFIRVFVDIVRIDPAILITDLLDLLVDLSLLLSQVPELLKLLRILSPLAGGISSQVV
jgi:hypothetical protein